MGLWSVNILLGLSSRSVSKSGPITNALLALDQIRHQSPEPDGELETVSAARACPINRHFGSDFAEPEVLIRRNRVNAIVRLQHHIRSDSTPGFFCNRLQRIVVCWPFAFSVKCRSVKMPSNLKSVSVIRKTVKMIIASIDP